jgi:hypothetical protein
MKSQALLLLVAFIACSANAQKVSYDRFKNRTNVVMESEPMDVDSMRAGVIHRAMHLLYEGESSTGKPSLFSITLSSISQDWRFLRCQTVDWLIDGKPATSKAQHVGAAIRNGVSETVIFSLDPALLANITESSNVEYRLCNTEFTLNTAMTRELSKRLVTELPK